MVTYTKGNSRRTYTIQGLFFKKLFYNS
ncbi:uncharacterized protein METZ01_LOCUS214599, partial [marine metagenome]